MTFRPIGTVTGQRATAEITDGRITVQERADNALINIKGVTSQPLGTEEPIAALTLAGGEMHAEVELTEDAVDDLIETLEDARDMAGGDSR